MERVEGAQTPYEVYCYRCHVTFPVESRRCLHCGGRLFAPGERAAVGPDPALGIPGLPAPAGEDAAAEGQALTLRRFGGLLIWGLVALSAILNSLCRG